MTATFIVYRTSDGLKACPLTSGIYLEMQQDPAVIEWWTVTAESGAEAIKRVRKEQNVNVLEEWWW